MGRTLNKQTYVEEAEKIITELKESSKKGKMISTSKLRSMLSMLSGLYNRVVHSNEKYLDEDVQHDLKYYKVRCAYEAGIDQEVKRFIEKTHMMDYVDWIENSKEHFVLYYHYVEALVAYHKYYGGE